MEKSKEFGTIVEALKVLHPNYHHFLDELLLKIYPMWAEQQDKTKTHFIHLLGLDSQEDAEMVLFDVLKALGWMKGVFHKLLLSRADCCQSAEILHMMLLHSGFAKVTYFPEANYLLRYFDSQEKTKEPTLMEIGDWFKNRDSLQVELDGKIFKTLSTGNLVITWLGCGFFGNDSVENNILELKNFKLERRGFYQCTEEIIEWPNDKNLLVDFFLKEVKKCSAVIDPNDCIFFLMDTENLIDFRNSLLEVRAKFEEMASKECGIPVECLNTLDNAFFDTWIPDLNSLQGFKDSYWDFLMTGFDFLFRTRKDFDSNFEKITVYHEVFWRLSLFWDVGGKVLSGNGGLLKVYEFDLLLFAKKMENE